MRKALLVMCAVLTLAGCSGQDDLHQWVAQEKQKRGAPIPPLPVIKTFETFQYNDQDKRDPFSPSTAELQTNTNTGPRPDENRAKEPVDEGHVPYNPPAGSDMAQPYGAAGHSTQGRW